MRTRTHAALAALMMFVGTAALVADKGDNNGGQNNGNEVRLRTQLAGAPIRGEKPEGNADFRLDQHGRTRLNVEVEHVNMPAGTVLTVAVHQGAMVTTVGTITITSFGQGELELNSEDGGMAPAIKSGDMVTVSAAGKTILAGAF